MREIRLISTDELEERHIPASIEDWQSFAQSFDGYDFFGDEETCRRMTSKSFEKFKATGKITSTLNHCRACLFYEYIKWSGVGGALEEESRKYVEALMKRIKDDVRMK